MVADLVSVVVYLTPAGTRDEGGVIQPAYLNFDATLLGPPANGLKVRDCASVCSHHRMMLLFGDPHAELPSAPQAAGDWMSHDSWLVLKISQYAQCDK